MTIQLPPPVGQLSARSLASRRIQGVLDTTLRDAVAYRASVAGAVAQRERDDDDVRLLASLDREIDRLNDMYGYAPEHIATCLGVRGLEGAAETAMDRLDPGRPGWAS
jgi:hypothetical protein